MNEIVQEWCCGYDTINSIPRYGQSNDVRLYTFQTMGATIAWSWIKLKYLPGNNFLFRGVNSWFIGSRKCNEKVYQNSSWCVLESHKSKFHHSSGRQQPENYSHASLCAVHFQSTSKLRKKDCTLHTVISVQHLFSYEVIKF